MDFNTRVKDVLKQFEDDYELSEMNANDELGLKNLAQIFVRLDDLNAQIIDVVDITDLDRLTRIQERLRKDASVIQNDLAITRRQRKTEKQEDLVTYIADIQARAKHLLSNRLSYIYCPRCKMLIANVWFLYPDQPNSIKLKCNRVVDVDSGKKCEHEFTVTSEELSKMGNRNIIGVLPT